MASDPILAERYYRQESEKYDFGTLAFSFEEFAQAIQRFDETHYTYDHGPIQRWQAALERSEPTTDADRSESRKKVLEDENLDPDTRNFYISIIECRDPLTEAQIQGLHAVAKTNEIADPVGILPWNQQRIYRLYYGDAPVLGESTPLKKSATIQRSSYVRQFSPQSQRKP